MTHGLAGRAPVCLNWDQSVASAAIVFAAGRSRVLKQIQRPLPGSVKRARWECGLSVAVSVFVLGTIPMRLHAGRTTGQPSETAGASQSQSPLPPRALSRIGTDDLRIRNSFITGIAFSPDGRLIAAAEANAPVPRVSLFDARTGRLARWISPPDRPHGWVQCVAFSPDGSKLAWGEVMGEVAVWDLTHDRLAFRQKYHGQSVNDVAFSPDGRILATGGEDGVVRLLRAEDPRETVQTLATGEQMPVRRGFTDMPAGGLPVGPPHLAFTPDGAAAHRRVRLERDDLGLGASRTAGSSGGSRTRTAIRAGQTPT